MAVIGPDSFASTPTPIGSSTTSPVPAATGQAEAVAAAAPPAPPQTGPQPLNTTGPLGTSVNIVT